MMIMSSSLLLLLLFLQAGFPAEGATNISSSNPLVPAYFVLGDSLVDVGNNNHLMTIARSDFLPYGVDFDTGKPTGRFSNGRVAVDYLTERFGLPFLPAYLDPSTKGSKLLTGVNFASSGCGILDFTGKVFGQNLPMKAQLEGMRDIRKQIVDMIGEQQTADLLGRSLFSVVIGSNDYLNNYLLGFTEASKQSSDDFQALLLSTFRSQLQTLHEIGARKLHVTSLPPIGCCPQSLSRFGSKQGECIQSVNKLAENYNAGLKALLEEIHLSLPGLQTVYTDTYYSFLSIYQNPKEHGFKVTSDACCGVGRYQGSFYCLPGIPSCSNPLEHIFFDEFHPNSKVAEIVAEKAFTGGKDINDPMNLLELVTS